MDVDLLSIQCTAHSLYSPRCDCLVQVLIHDERPGGVLSLIDSDDALADAQQHWAVRTLKSPARKRRCMRFRVSIKCHHDDGCPRDPLNQTAAPSDTDQTG
jgi:hypothetical protein